MISMDKIDSVRKKYRRGEGVASIARDLQVSRDTVCKYARMEDPSPKTPVKKGKRPGKMDRWAPYVDQWLEDDMRENRKQRHTAHRIWRRPTQELGGDVAESTVRCHVHFAKQGMHEGAEQCLDLEWPAGEAQVDFGSADFVARGTRMQLPYFVMSFPHSNVGLMQVMPGQNSKCVRQGMESVFEFVGGVPTAVMFDNATGAGGRIADTIRPPALFKALSAHYGFEYRFCNPRAGHGKGSVENKVGALRRALLVPVPRVWSMDGCNSRLLEGCMALSKGKEHWRKGESEDVLFHEDAHAFLALPGHPFSCVTYRRAVADKKGKVRVDGGHRYSTSPEYAGQEIDVADVAILNWTVG